MTGTSSMRRHDRPALRVQPLEPIATKISRQITDWSYVRALCDADAIELHEPMVGGGGPVACLVALMQRRQTKVRLYFPLGDLERSECNSEVALIETAWADSR